MTGGLAARRETRLAPDRRRVLARLFVPGHTDHTMREGRASGVVAQMLALDDDAVHDLLVGLVDGFGDRHRDVLTTFRLHADRIANRLGPDVELSDERWLVLGAAFTMEYAVEGAALCNPSMVAHPDQRGVPAGAVRFVMSVRQIGEGHRSSIGFRGGMVGPGGDITLDAPTTYATAGTIVPCTLEASTFLRAAERDDREATSWVLDGLGGSFSQDAFEARLVDLERQRDTRQHAEATAARLRAIASRSYAACFPPGTPLGERELHPAVAVESNGMEDARFVRFTDDDGSVSYRATYTAFDGRMLAQQLLTTTDFDTFVVAPLLGAAAANKGLALFPRRIDGRYAALSRFDGASNAVARSDDLHVWPSAVALDQPQEVWESVQVGNCGPPIETPEGWLVLTHGVGPMRTYSMGAVLLDLEAPERVLGRLREPLLAPLPSERDGYVPNVVYSCGALLHDRTLVVPYGIGDASIGFATVGVDDLLAALR